MAKAIADPSRVCILKLLAGAELCECQITTVLGLVILMLAVPITIQVYFNSGLA